MAASALVLLTPSQATAQTARKWQPQWIEGALSNIGEGYYGASHVVIGSAGETFEYNILLGKPDAGWYIRIAAANGQTVIEDYTGSSTRHSLRGVFPHFGIFTISLIATEPGSYSSALNTLILARYQTNIFQYADPEGDAQWAGAPDITDVKLSFGDTTVTIEVAFAGTTLDRARTELCVAFDTDRTEATGGQWEGWPKGADRIISVGRPTHPCIAGATVMSRGNDDRAMALDVLQFTGAVNFTANARFFVWAFDVAQDGTVRISDAAPGPVSASRWLSLGGRSAATSSALSVGNSGLNGFCFTYGGGAQGFRKWIREATHWVELNPDGHRTSFVVVAGAGPDGQAGEVLAALPARTFEVFMPAGGPTGTLWIRDAGQAWRRGSPIHPC